MALRLIRGARCVPTLARPCGNIMRMGARWSSTTAPPPPPSSEQSSDAPKAAEGVNGEEKISADEDIFDDHMTPPQVVEQLDKYIIGQQDAKRAMALALRNRWRRHRVEGPLKDEIAPKNILMVGPTGVGKTEVARRLAKLTNAPFCKVECTKFTEVGYHGKDVDSIIDDLLRASILQVKNYMRKVHKKRAREVAIQSTLKALCGESLESREIYKKMLEAEPLHDEMARVNVEVTVTNKKADKVQLGQMMVMVGEPGPERRSQTMNVKEALEHYEQEEMERLLSSEDVMSRAVRACEEDGIVVLDEIDKIVVPGGVSMGASASAEGVQQDLLPLVEGTSVTTKIGPTVRTDRILFIASGAFHNAKPKDMLAELQGRLPIRVELQPLSQKDFLRILTEPKTNLIRQHVEMMKTEGVNLDVTEGAIKEMARVAFQCNQIVQNIGARRLITVTEKVLENLSFEAPERAGEKITITENEVKTSVSGLLKNDDLRKFIL